MPGVPIENLKELWPMAEPMLKRAIEKGEYGWNIEDVKLSCEIGEYILWIVRNGNAAVILEVFEYHKGRQCDILMIGGDFMDEWIEEIKEIESWAKRIGCDRMILTGRIGWQKILTEYSVKTITMVKMI